MLEPKSIEILLHRVAQIEGLTIEELANNLGVRIPFDLKYAKGFIGQLIEIALGASGNSNPIHDFPHLGIELKTIPVNYDGKPTNNTHICTLYPNSHYQTFENSNFYNKLKKILWVPIEGDKKIHFTQRHIGRGFLWELKEADLEIIKNDWFEIMELLTTNPVESVSAKIGTYAHIAPSGTNKGQKQYGFYLRRSFTHKILFENFN
jgi:DNA mismatch repair protein MutH